MKYQTEKIVLVDGIAKDISIKNYSHFKLTKGGVILTSNKGIGLKRLYLPNERIEGIYFK